MSDGCKKTKADLIALFRLEFYRKQNNWKFCNQIHQKDKKGASRDKAKTSITKPKEKDKLEEKCLNKTYAVEAHDDDERSVLNKAFVETDNDKNISKWSSDSQDETSKLAPHSNKQDLANLEHNSPNRDRNPTENFENIHNWPQYGDQKPQEEQNWPFQDRNWPRDEEKYYRNTPETKCNENCLQLKVENYKGIANNYQNCQQNWLQDEPETKVMQNWANIAMSKIDKNVENCLRKEDNDWPKADKMAEPIFQNWHNWKESPMLSVTTQNLQEKFQENVKQNDFQCKGWPDLDKEAYEGPEAEWPQQTQVWTTKKLTPESIWSEDVLRELKLLNTHDLDDDGPTGGEKWVPPDRLLHWMMANKECCEDLLETSSSESEEQFMRAAHCAPHSSEVDIQPQLDALEASEEVVAGSLEPGALTESALRAVGRAHACALKRVASELRARERIKEDMQQRSRSTGYSTMATPRYDISCEEYPTRDIGLHQPTYIDTFISGSYKNNPNVKQLEKQTDTWGNDGLMHLEGGQIVLNRGRMGQEWGQIAPERGQMAPEWCQMGRLRVEGDQIVIDRGEMSFDQCHTGLDGCQTGQPGGFGDNNLIGRGRGRLQGMKSEFGVGRGRGRI